MTQDITNYPFFDKVWLDKYIKLPKVPEDWVSTYTDMKKYLPQFGDMDEIGSWNIYVLIPTFTAPVTSEKLKNHFIPGGYVTLKENAKNKVSGWLGIKVLSMGWRKWFYPW